MEINIIDVGVVEGFQPIVGGRTLKDCPVGGTTLEKGLIARIEYFIARTNCRKESCFNIRADFWPSVKLIDELIASENAVVCGSIDGEETPLAWIASGKEIPQNATRIKIDDASRILRYSWDLLFVNEEIIGSLQESKIEGTIRDGVTIDGNVIVGEGSVLLPGVYIEGNAIIGKNCKIGPNCYIRGKTHVGDNCHLGQAVEIKNSILMDKVSVGHLSYVGDSILGERTNFGAGTIVANLRHDGKNHKSVIKDEMVDTGRRKLGVIVGDDVHTGINTTLYPGRKLWVGTSTLPGEIVKKDKRK